VDRSIALLVAIVCVVAILKAIGAGNLFGQPRPIAKRFLTARETAMLTTLERALPHCRIHAQVAMGALLQVPNNPLRKRRLSDRNAFSQKIVDFVAQDRATGAILALIEVDDRSHHADRDRVRDEMTGYAGYRTVRIPGRVQPNYHDVVAIVGHLRAPIAATFTEQPA
jgi:very-short-patch-repair endonuclease